MKTKYLYILILFASINASAQVLESNLWHINKIIGQSDTFLDEYLLKKIENPEGKNFVYGNSISFHDGKFNSHYSAKCGNDCFPSSQGTYKMISDKYIEITLLTFDQQGDCPSIHKEYNSVSVFEIIKKSETTILLKKTTLPIVKKLPK